MGGLAFAEIKLILLFITFMHIIIDLEIYNYLMFLVRSYCLLLGAILIVFLSVQLFL